MIMVLVAKTTITIIVAVTRAIVVVVIIIHIQIYVTAVIIIIIEIVNLCCRVEVVVVVGCGRSGIQRYHDGNQLIGNVCCFLLAHTYVYRIYITTVMITISTIYIIIFMALWMMCFNTTRR